MSGLGTFETGEYGFSRVSRDVSVSPISHRGATRGEDSRPTDASTRWWWKTDGSGRDGRAQGDLPAPSTQVVHKSICTILRVTHRLGSSPTTDGVDEHTAQFAGFRPRLENFPRSLPVLPVVRYESVFSFGPGTKSCIYRR
jgi:hypothetical protein